MANAAAVPDNDPTRRSVVEVGGVEVGGVEVGVVEAGTSVSSYRSTETSPSGALTQMRISVPGASATSPLRTLRTAPHVSTRVQVWQMPIRHPWAGRQTGRLGLLEERPAVVGHGQPTRREGDRATAGVRRGGGQGEGLVVVLAARGRRHRSTPARRPSGARARTRRPRRRAQSRSAATRWPSENNPSRSPCPGASVYTVRRTTFGWPGREPGQLVGIGVLVGRRARSGGR